MESFEDNEIQYKGPKVEKKERRITNYEDHLPTKLSDRIRVAEASTIKIMYSSGSNVTDIAKILNRSHQTVIKVVNDFDKYLPKDRDLGEKISAQIKNITDSLAARSRSIIEKADEVVYDRLDNMNVSPLEAARISEKYLDRFGRIMGESRLQKIREREDPENDEHINKILNTMFNININMEPQKDDRYRTPSKIIDADPKPTKGSKKGSTKKNSKA